MNRLFAGAGAALALLAVGCGGFFRGGSPPGPVERRFQEGLAALEAGDFSGASERLRALASSCESGATGRTSVLLLASVELDLRNPTRNPDEAARLAAAYLRLPRAGPEELALARTLYLLAVDQGGGVVEPGGDGDQEGPATTVAGRFQDCDGGGVVEWRRVLPTHPGGRTADRLEELETQRDSLHLRARALQAALGRAGTRIEELEAELERIRKLLREGGGGISRPPGP